MPTKACLKISRELMPTKACLKMTCSPVFPCSLVHIYLLSSTNLYIPYYIAQRNTMISNFINTQSIYDKRNAKILILSKENSTYVYIQSKTAYASLYNFSKLFALRF